MNAPPLTPPATGLERRVVLLLPSGNDGAHASRVLNGGGIEAAVCVTMEELCATAEAGAAALLVAEERLAGSGAARLTSFLERQPAWSDIPLILLTNHGREATAHWRLMAEIPSVRNSTLLERPMRTETLLQAVRVALRTRERQYQLRTYMMERESLLVKREMLLDEIHHRVKNNLHMIQGLVQMSVGRSPPQMKPIFDELVGRIGAISQLHTLIYTTGNVTVIDAATYLAGIVDQVEAAFGAMRERVRIGKRLEPVAVDVDTAIPLGLITTELLTNAYKYAFPSGSAGEIHIELALHSGSVELTVADDGIGLPKGGPSPRSTGLRLVQGLAKQIRGTFATSAGPGARGTLLFPLKDCGEQSVLPK